MDIKTKRLDRETDGPAEIAPPEKSMYLRRKTTQQVRKSNSSVRFLVTGLQLLCKLAVLVLVVTFLVSIVVYAYTSDKFVLKNVKFVGCTHGDPGALESAIRKEFPAHILRIDLKRLRARLEQEVWIQKAEIRRVLPSDLVIYVRERVPSVILEIQGELMLADEEGVLLDRYDPRYGKLDVPVFKGVLGDSAENYRLYQEENSERVRLGVRMLAELESGSSAFTRNISEVDLSDKNDARVILVDDPAEILMGDRDFLKKFRTLMANMSQYQEVKSRYNDLESADLRYEGQIIYRPRKSAEGQTASAMETRRQ